MAKLFVLGVCLACTTATALPKWKRNVGNGTVPGALAANLRGVAPSAAPPAAPSSASKSAVDKPFVDDRGERGHFYYSDECKDCFYKGAQCGCEPAVEYFACLTKHCSSSNEAVFAEKCLALGNKCSDEIDIDCQGPDTVCKSKFHQLVQGGLGLDVKVGESEAFCGPFGNCIGHLHMVAKIVNAPKKQTKVSVAPVAGPAPAAAPAPAAPEAPVEEAAPLWLECGLPVVSHPDVDNEKDWNICRVEAEDGKADCDLSMPEKWIKASQSKKAYCLLKDAEDGKRLTQPSWHQISNSHDKTDVAAAVDEPAAKKAAKEAAAKKAVKKKAAVKKAPKEEAVAETPDVFGKPPWMLEKEERAAASKEKEQEVAAGPKYGGEGCPCVGIDNLEGETMALVNGKDTVMYPADLGARCEAWDNSDHPKCPGASWCSQQWCYVDPCNCNIPVLPKPASYIPSAEYQGKPLFFSYATCGGKDSYTGKENKKNGKTAKLIEETCAVDVSEKKWGDEDCRCVGIGPQPGSTKVNIKDKMVAFPADTGATCTAWEEHNHPDCQGKDAYPYPEWCTKAWCYVDPCKCKLATPPKTSSYLPEGNYQGRPVYYSYATCGAEDKFSAGDKKACVNQNTTEGCKSLDKCAWSGTECLGKELVEVCKDDGADEVAAEDEAKEEKEEENEEAPKEEKESKEAEPKEEAAPALDGSELPWMVDKAKRQAARAERAEEKAEEEKEEAEPKKVEKKEHDNESGLPWMEGKKNPKALQAA